MTYLYIVIRYVLGMLSVKEHSHGFIAYYLSDDSLYAQAASRVFPVLEHYRKYS